MNYDKELHAAWGDAMRAMTHLEAIDEEPDAVIVLMFHRGSGQFKIKCSKIENRLELIGALEEAKNHVIVNGYTA